MFNTYTFRDLKTSIEFSEFAKGYMTAFNGKKLAPVQTLNAEKLHAYHRVIGVYQGGKMVAGYIINQYPHRCFEYLSDTEQNNILASLGGAHNVCEVVAIWKSKSISRLNFTLRIWSAITMDTLKEGRTIIFGCAYAGHGMLKRYSMLNPAIARAGTHDNDLTILYFHRWKCVLTYLAGASIICLQEIYRKLARTQWRNREITNE